MLHYDRVLGAPNRAAEGGQLNWGVMKWGRYATQLGLGGDAISNLFSKIGATWKGGEQYADDLATLVITVRPRGDT